MSEEVESTKKHSKLANFKGKQGTNNFKKKQPSPQSKKEGWAKRKTGQALAKAILDLKFKGKTGSQIKREAAAYYGVPEEEITIEQIMMFRQAEKAIQAADTHAFKAVMERAHGAPKQEIESTGAMAITITRKIIDNGNKPQPDVHSSAE